MSTLTDELRAAVIGGPQDVTPDMLTRAADEIESLACRLSALSNPIPMVLHCPACGTQHIDAPEPEKGWDNPPHKSHLCHGCGAIWRPAGVPTTGVASLDRLGEHDTWKPGDSTSAFRLDRALAIIHELFGAPADSPAWRAAAEFERECRVVEKAVRCGNANCDALLSAGEPHVEGCLGGDVERQETK